MPFILFIDIKSLLKWFVKTCCDIKKRISCRSRHTINAIMQMKVLVINISSPTKEFTYFFPFVESLRN